MRSLHTGLRVARIVSTLVLMLSVTGGIAAAYAGALERGEPALKKANAYIQTPSVPKTSVISFRLAPTSPA